jgi:ParB/RepB/Spo0J family partition protein
MSALDRLKNRAGPVKEGTVDVPLNKLRFDPTQPRKAFHHVDGRVEKDSEEYIEELATAIDSEGLIHPITVQENGDGTYTVIVGECRTRAHLFLKRETIKATIRNDLVQPAQRLLFQLSENVNRKDLSDYELALSIKLLLTGQPGVPPLKQVDIAKSQGKSEGWVSRFVKFADDELQRTWVLTGIADTVEKVYRLSTLAKPLQLDIQRRVLLPEGDLNRLEKPLNREVIDQLTRTYKAREKGGPESTMAPAPAPAPVESPDPYVAPTSLPAAPSNSVHANTGNSSLSDAVIDEALMQAAAEGKADRAPPVSHKADAQPTAGGYQLDADARSKILGSAGEAVTEGEAKGRGAVRPPVNCRLTLAGILSLAKAVNDNPELRKSIETLVCELNIPGPLASLIANEFTGHLVDEREVTAVLQTEMAKLR